MPRNGTLAICLLELEFNGYNQVALNLVKGGLHKGYAGFLPLWVSSLGHNVTDRWRKQLD
jgi:hypothetical protein